MQALKLRTIQFRVIQKDLDGIVWVGEVYNILSAAKAVLSHHSGSSNAGCIA